MLSKWGPGTVFYHDLASLKLTIPSPPEKLPPAARVVVNAVAGAESAGLEWWGSCSCALPHAHSHTNNQRCNGHQPFRGPPPFGAILLPPSYLDQPHFYCKIEFPIKLSDCVALLRH